ncbi:MAG: NAD-dependent epimerase/dehydratase family protein [Alkalispirochaeta sp.]
MHNKTVVVTGASGYLGSWIVKQALEAGFTVRGTVRDHDDPEKTHHLRDLPYAERLTLHRADLLEKGAFHEIVAGADAVIHSASPFFAQHVDNAKEALVRPAVEGTRNVLTAAGATPSVRRVVLTSSVAAVIGDARDAADNPGRRADESCWNNVSSETYDPYSYSKTAAERIAWEDSSCQSQWDLVVINPAFIIGPSLSRRLDATSVSLIRRLGDGTFRTGVPELTMGFVDVRDVALAHIRVLETPEASGRVILAERVATLPEMVRVLRDQFGPEYSFPRRTVPKRLFWLIAPRFGLDRRYVARNVGIPFMLDTTRSREMLGIQYRDTRTTVIEHFQQLVDAGAVPAN